jgi:hypothetical protein
LIGLGFLLVLTLQPQPLHAQDTERVAVSLASQPSMDPWLCDYQNGWHRVVYPGEGQEAAACLRSSDQMPEPGSVTGPCRSGWVHGNWVRWLW